MKRNKKISLFIYFCLIQYLIDSYQNPCETNIGESLLLFHHFVSGYIYLGGFLFNPLYHLIFCTIVLIHWITNGRCELTVITNKYCEYQESKKFNDFLQILHISTINQNIHWYLLPVLIFYDLYKIFNL
tara:strand:+ start:1330 stop:1716 length:387 start_codon:yes stop_codon:yes gene_type:complete